MQVTCRLYYVLARISGEGSVRRPERGDVLLTDAEVRDILNAEGARRYLESLSTYTRRRLTQAARPTYRCKLPRTSLFR